VGEFGAGEATGVAKRAKPRVKECFIRAELTHLRAALIKVLTAAIKLGGSSVSDYVDADGVAGFFQLHHHVYSRTGEPCRVCKTPIKRIVVAGRGTHFCPTCQR
jgi:formamidopyrimidine-DNA glycosylase